MRDYFLIIAPIVLIISILITLNIFFQQSLQMEVAEQFNSQQHMLARSISENVLSYIETAQENLIIISRFIGKGVIRASEMASLLKNPTDKEGHIRHYIGVVDEWGKVILTDGNSEKVSSIALMLIDKRELREKDRSMVLSKDNDLIIVSPIYRSEHFKGLLFFTINIHDIAEHYLKRIRFGAGGYPWMIDRSGTLLYHPTQPSMVGGNIYNTEPRCYSCHSNFNLEKKILEGKVTSFGKYISPTGENKIIAFAPIEIGKISWIIAVSSPYSDVTKATENSMALYSYLIIAIFVTTIVISTMLIIFNKKRIQSEELAKRQQVLEQYAEELADKVQEKTAELVSEKEKLNTILSALAVGVIMIDKQAKIQWANQAMKELAGEDVTAKYCEEICPECSILSIHQDKERDVDTILMTNLFNKKDHYFQITTAPIKGEDGEVHGYIRLFHDVTEMKKMEEHIAHSEKLASIGRLAAGIAHEIGNPMTSIFSFVQILREEEDDPFKKESLDTIYFHVNRVSGILKQLSGFSKMPAGDTRECNINEIIETSVNLIQYDKKAKSITMTKHLDPILPTVMADGNQLSQVFVNLILNAVDAMPEGGELTISTETRDHKVVISFRDTGVGIKNEDKAKIFDPFYTTKEKGTGLGLAVSYNIIKKMNGTITVDSEIGKGTTFTITLPIN
jgi:PAS domain S-box-containing protein